MTLEIAVHPAPAGNAHPCFIQADVPMADLLWNFLRGSFVVDLWLLSEGRCWLLLGRILLPVWIILFLSAGIELEDIAEGQFGLREIERLLIPNSYGLRCCSFDYKVFIKA